VDPGLTYSCTDPARRIDYIFASPRFPGHLDACEVVSSEESRTASDHLPVWADFSL
jgi:endonuclease/exonuclease/phosphatase family metal-dependent hydrolase